MYLSTTTKHMWLSSKTRNQLACGALRHTRHLPIRSELQAFLSEGIDQVFRDFGKRKFYSIKLRLVTSRWSSDWIPSSLSQILNCDKVHVLFLGFCRSFFKNFNLFWYYPKYRRRANQIAKSIIINL